MTLHKIYIQGGRERVFSGVVSQRPEPAEEKGGEGGPERDRGKAEDRRERTGNKRGKPGEDGGRRERLRSEETEEAGEKALREGGMPFCRVLRRGCFVCKKGRSIVWSARRKKKGPSEGAFSRRRSGRPPGIRFGKSGIFSQNPPSGSCIRRGIYAIIRRIAERSDRSAAAMVRKGTFGGGAWSMPYPG